MMTPNPKSFYYASFLTSILTLQSIAKASSSISPIILHLPRGGSSPYELNPNYSPNQPITLADLERRHHPPPPTTPPHRIQFTQTNPTTRPKPITEIIQSFFTQLRETSPTLHAVTLSSIVIFILWQFPHFTQLLQNHFVCSRTNIRQKRYHSLLLSSISHVSLLHLLLNLYAFCTFGVDLRHTLSSKRQQLYPFVLGSALFSSLTHLLLKPDEACIGLSGVTLAMLAFEARYRPSRELGIWFVIPLRMAAEHALIGIGFVSCLGVLGRGGSDSRVAHAAHLGGIGFGLIYFEGFVRGWWWRIRKMMRRRGLLR